MSPRRLLIIFAIAITGCASCRVDDVSVEAEALKPLQSTTDPWSPPLRGLAVRLAVDTPEVSPDDTMQARVHIRASEPDTDHPKLLQGNVVLTFVPVSQAGAGKTVSVSHHFSGAGGVGYTGNPPLGDFALTTPAEPGAYNLIATVISTREQIDRFLMTARITAGAGPWWTGVMSSPPLHVTVR